MRFKLRKCKKCKRYTFKETCPVCGCTTVLAHPAKFSPDDRYAILKAKALGKIQEE